MRGLGWAPPGASSRTTAALCSLGCFWPSTSAGETSESGPSGRRAGEPEPWPPARTAPPSAATSRTRRRLRRHVVGGFPDAPPPVFTPAEIPGSVPTSVGRFGGVGLGVAPPPPDPALHPEGAALVVEPPALLQGAQQLVQRLWEVLG